ncbi:unnamed protein product [Caenorhabditis angaria]|uniref:CHHC U11-48K-type domain-containing protein n=1 Tax=Caenorhabditis angaria TaxID=860376 RepID=A0A9P1I9V3_9PELO|nr:unnamed protein product [Caenorhabditis angaria]
MEEEASASFSEQEENPPCAQMSSDRKQEDTNPDINCPYNKNHKISIIDFNTHILQCRMETMKYHPHSLKFVRCSYNFRHFLPQQELAFHEAFCRSTSKFDKMQRELSIEPIILDVPNVLAQENDSDEEDVVDYRMRKRIDKQEKMKNEKEEESEEEDEDSDESDHISTSSTITDDEQEIEDVEFGRVLRRKDLLEVLKN